MKAYCFRSGHVLLGRTVPPGAIELADYDNEAELLLVVRWNTMTLNDAESRPEMVIPTVMMDSDYEIAVVHAAEARALIQRDLERLKGNPRILDNSTVKPLALWPDEWIDLANRTTCEVPA